MPRSLVYMDTQSFHSTGLDDLDDPDAAFSSALEADWRFASPEVGVLDCALVSAAWATAAACPAWPPELDRKSTPLNYSH